MMVSTKDQGSNDDLFSGEHCHVRDHSSTAVAAAAAAVAAGQRQNGFMMHRGCTDAVFCLKVALQKRKEHMQDSWVLFIDLVKAFDTVNRTALIAILKKFGVPSQLAVLIERLHTDVKVKLKVGTTDILFDATIGVKQGDNMAPVLFLFYIHAAIEVMEKERRLRAIWN